MSFRKAQAGQNAKKELQATVREAIEEEKSIKEIITEVKEAMAKSSGITEQDAVVMVSLKQAYLRANVFHSTRYLREQLIAQRDD